MNAEKDKKEKKPYADDYNKDRVLGCLAASYPNGKSTTEMEQSLPIHHDTVLRKCNELRKDRAVIKKGGKFGKYYLTDFALGDPNLISARFAHRVVEELFSNLNIGVSLDNIYCNRELIREILDPIKRKLHVGRKNMGIPLVQKNTQLRIRLSESQLYKLGEIAMFEVVNKIGAIVTYNLISALDPEKLPVITGRQSGDKKKIKYIEKKDKLQTDLIDRQLTYALQPLLLLWGFKNYWQELLGPESTASSSPFSISEKHYKLVVEIFLKNYPHIFKKLESIRKKLDSDKERVYEELVQEEPII